MWFKNKQTGLVWEIEALDSIKRCQNDDTYEEVEAPIHQETEVKNKKTSKKK